MTNDELLNGGICMGTPLRLVDGGELVFFRSARYSPHAEEMLSIVADEAGGCFAVTAEELRRNEEDDK